MYRIYMVLFLMVTCCFLGSRVYAQHETLPKQDLAAMVESFLSGLRPESPKQAVEWWIHGVKNRSGAVQYATLSSNLQQKTKEQFNKRSWGTGQSSPWIEHVRIAKEERIGSGKVRFNMEYDLVTSNWKWERKGQKMITVERVPNQLLGHWFITEISTPYNEWEAFTPAETVVR